MRKRIETSPDRADALLKEALWLAWAACRHPSDVGAGYGWLQNRPGATKEEVWNNVTVSSSDYSGLQMSHDGYFNADYVFGRRLKLRVERPRPGVLEFEDDVRPGYEGDWRGAYPTLAALFAAAAEAVDAKEEA